MPSIEEQLRAFAKTDRFRKLCNEAKIDCKKSGKRFGQPGSGLTKEEAIGCAENMAQILRSEVMEIRNIYGEPFLDHIEVGEPMPNPDGSYRVNVWFNRDEMHRDSLYPEKYPDGIENIALLFAKGYDARTQVFGVDSHGKSVASLTHRGPNDFMGRAISRFNENMRGFAVAEANEQYL